MKSIINFLKQKHLYQGIARYLLGLGMLTYALTKILRTQFVVLPFSTWQVPLVELPGTKLAWAFLGHSAWFQVLLGCLELVPALLLLYRRTTLMGGILMLPMTLNVALINYALNLWPGTKVISLIFLALNIVVLLFEIPRIKAIILLIAGKGQRIRFTPAELVINTIVILGVGYMSLQPLLEYKAETNALTGDWLNQHPNQWILKQDVINDTTIIQQKTGITCYFEAFGRYEEITGNATKPIPTAPTNYVLNQAKHTLTLTNPETKISIDYTYTLTGDSILRLQRIAGVDNNMKLTRTFTRHIIRIK
jgi:hypothetical protein